MEFVYGKSDSAKYAVAVEGSETWAATEEVGGFYHIVNFDDIPECDWGRIDNLETRILAETKR